jgi:ADP-ribose pyrophosphatase YjhB (NUDIX family)
VRLKALVWIVRPSQGGPEVLLLQRPARRGAGEHPVTGKADPGESAIDCAAREASEETGLTGDLRVPRDAEPRLSDEHVAARWVTPKEARAVLGWEAHREALDLALDAF